MKYHPNPLLEGLKRLINKKCFCFSERLYQILTIFIANFDNFNAGLKSVVFTCQMSKRNSHKNEYYPKSARVLVTPSFIEPQNLLNNLIFNVICLNHQISILSCTLSVFIKRRRCSCFLSYDLTLCPTFSIHFSIICR